MSGDWRQRARERVSAQVEADLQEYFDDGDVLSEDQFDTAMRVNRLRAFQAMDPQARLDEELTLRLMGETLPEGMLLVGVADPILRRLQDMIDALVGTKVQLGLAALSPGSTVLHLRPVYQRAAPAPAIARERAEFGEDSGERQLGESPADHAMEHILRLVAAAESGEDLHGPPGAIAAFEKLVATLENSAIDVDFGWFASSGLVRRGSLTSQGRTYTQRKMLPQVSRSQHMISGYIRELSAPSGQGRIVIKPSSRKGSTVKIQIDSDQLVSLGLAFGEWVSIRVTREERTDPLTSRVAVSDTFLELQERRRDH